MVGDTQEHGDLRAQLKQIFCRPVQSWLFSRGSGGVSGRHAPTPNACTASCTDAAINGAGRCGKAFEAMNEDVPFAAFARFNAGGLTLDEALQLHQAMLEAMYFGDIRGVRTLFHEASTGFGSLSDRENGELRPRNATFSSLDGFHVVLKATQHVRTTCRRP